MEMIGFAVGVFAMAISCGLIWYCHSELSKMEKQVQAALIAMFEQQGSALQLVVEKQSEVNKVYKAHLEKVLETQKWHNEILRFQDGIAQPLSLAEIEGVNNAIEQ